MPNHSEKRLVTTTMVEATSSVPAVKTVTPTEGAAIRRRLGMFIARECGGSQTAAAKRIGVSQQSVNNIMLGKDPGFGVARKVATGLGLSVDHALGPWTLVDDLIWSHPKRWSSSTIAAVRMMPRAEILALDALERLLDRVDTSLRPIQRDVQRGATK